MGRARSIRQSPRVGHGRQAVGRHAHEAIGEPRGSGRVRDDAARFHRHDVRGDHRAVRDAYAHRIPTSCLFAACPRAAPCSPSTPSLTTAFMNMSDELLVAAAEHVRTSVPILLVMYSL